MDDWTAKIQKMNWQLFVISSVMIHEIIQVTGWFKPLNCEDEQPLYKFNTFWIWIIA